MACHNVISYLITFYGVHSITWETPEGAFKKSSCLLTQPSYPFLGEHLISGSAEKHYIFSTCHQHS